MQFSLRFLLLMVTALGVLFAIVFSAPDDVAFVALLLLFYLIPMVVWTRLWRQWRNGERVAFELGGLTAMILTGFVATGAILDMRGTKALHQAVDFLRGLALVCVIVWPLAGLLTVFGAWLRTAADHSLDQARRLTSEESPADESG